MALWRCVLLRLRVDRVGDVAGGVLIGAGLGWKDASEEGVARLVRRWAIGATLAGSWAVSRHRWLQACCQGFLVIFQNLFGMVRTLR